MRDKARYIGQMVVISLVIYARLVIRAVRS